MKTQSDRRCWRAVFRSFRVRLAIAGVALLGLATIATILHVLDSQPSFRGRSASYWRRALKTSLDNNNSVCSAPNDWMTRSSISLGIRHPDEDAYELFHGTILTESLCSSNCFGMTMHKYAGTLPCGSAG
jgi:hypothetical protein